MFLRSSDEKHVVEVHRIDLGGTKLLVSEELFETFTKKDDAPGAVRAVSREICLTDSFLNSPVKDPTRTSTMMTTEPGMSTEGKVRQCRENIRI